MTHVRYTRKVVPIATVKNRKMGGRVATAGWRKEEDVCASLCSALSEVIQVDGLFDGLLW